MPSIRNRILSVIAVPACGPLKRRRQNIHQRTRLARQHDMVTEFRT